MDWERQNQWEIKREKETNSVTGGDGAVQDRAGGFWFQCFFSIYSWEEKCASLLTISSIFSLSLSSVSCYLFLLVVSHGHFTWSVIDVVSEFHSWRVYVWEREREAVCVCVRERGCVFVCVRETVTFTLDDWLLKVAHRFLWAFEAFELSCKTVCKCIWEILFGCVCIRVCF